MSVVRLLIDPFGTQEGAAIYHVSSQADYVAACRAIDQALVDERRLEIAVHNKAMASWFDGYRQSPLVTVEICDPCQMLASALRVDVEDLPSEIKDDPKVIVSASLLRCAEVNPRKQEQDVVSWLLGHIFGGLWSKTTIDSAQDVTELVSALATAAPVGMVCGALEALRKKRVEEWQRRSVHANLVRWVFAGDPRRRAETLLLCRAIWGYPPETRQRALEFEGRWAELCQLPELSSVMQAISLDSCVGIHVPAGYSRTVRDFLTHALAEHSFPATAGFLSGCLEDERTVILAYLAENAELVDDTWADALHKAVRTFSRGAGSKGMVEFLHRLQPVSPPTPIRSTDDWTRVSSWAEYEYLPFWAWCSATRRLHRTTSSVDQFQEWLLVNYDALTRTEAFAPYALRMILKELLGRLTTLLVIADGLPWVYGASLSSLLGERGINHVSQRTCLTTIPSLTDVAKRSLVCGQLPGQIGGAGDSERGYGEHLASMLGLQAGELVCATSMDSSLTDMMRRRGQAYLYLYNEIDRQLIHAPLSHEVRHARVQSSLAELASDIAAARQEFQNTRGEELAIVVASDHGFTDIPRESPQVTIPDNDGWEISHGRIAHREGLSEVVVPDAVLVGPSMLGGLAVSFIVPKGYAYLETRPRGATHGGLTPQEMVVPMLIVRTSVEAYRPVEVAVNGAIRRGRSDNPVTIQLVNGNRQPLTVRHIGLDFVSLSLPRQLIIPPDSVVELRATLDARSIREDQMRLTGEVVVELQGRCEATHILQTVRTIGAAVIDRSFEEDFDV